LKGLYGEPTRLQAFTNAFKTIINQFVEKIPDDKKASYKSKTSSSSVNSAKGSNLYKFQTNKGKMKSGSRIYEDDDDSDNESKMGAYNETSSIY
jgi:hypothetical protein